MADRRRRMRQRRPGGTGGVRPTARRTVGLADCTPEDWRRIVATSAAPSEEDDTYQDWLEARDHALAMLAAHGVQARLVPVRADAFFAWLQAQGLPNLSKHRADYVVDLLRHGGAGP